MNDVEQIRTNLEYQVNDKQNALQQRQRRQI